MQQTAEAPKPHASDLAPPLAETPSVPWQAAMKRAIRSQRELRQRLDLPPDPAADAAESFPTFVPLELLGRIRRGDLDDPILRQVLADQRETEPTAGFVNDPVGDLEASVASGLLHKYHGRALIVTHGACAIHCRYCFRREYPYSQDGARANRWDDALAAIARDESIEEVLLSGGDPLTLTDEVIDRLLSRLEDIAHVRRVRVHTRLPIAIPQRITPELVERLSRSRLAAWIVIHCNHAQEIDDHVSESIRTITSGGLPVLNQAVLLAGVNDRLETLLELSRALIDRNVQPYYLHQMDRVRGASHFWVPTEQGRQLVSEMRKRLPGYAVPEYVVEEAGAASKTPLG